MRSTPELPEIAESIERWTQIGLTVDPLDHAAAEAALSDLYVAAGLPPPCIVWAPCPMTAMLSAIVYTGVRRTGRMAEAHDDEVLADLVERITRYALVATAPPSAPRRMRRAVEQTVATALSVGEAGRSRCDPGLAIANARRAAMDRAVQDCVALPLYKRVFRKVYLPIRRSPVWALRQLLQASLGSIAEGTVGRRSRLAAKTHLGGPASLADAAKLDYLNRVLGIPLDRRFIEPSARAHLFWTLNGVCLAAERPTRLNWDVAGRLHCEVGPSVAYRSGWSWWHWHGIAMPEAAIEAPERLTIDAIHRAAAEARPILIERYRSGEPVHGIAAYLRDRGAECLDGDPKFGTLWRLDGGTSAPMLMLEVENRSPEPDGSYRRFLLRVHPKLRALLDDGGFGPEQAPTIRNAVASTFGLAGEEYAPQIES